MAVRYQYPNMVITDYRSVETGFQGLVVIHMRILILTAFWQLAAVKLFV